MADADVTDLIVPSHLQILGHSTSLQRGALPQLMAACFPAGRLRNAQQSQIVFPRS